MRTRQQTWLVSLLGFTVIVGAGVWTVRAGSQAGGLGHVVLNTPAGAVWTWGQNPDGQLGSGNTTARRVPGAVSGVGTITAVAAGASHTLALDNTGRIWVWGDNTTYGALGDGTTTDRLAPVQLGLTSVTKIAAGGNHSLALRSTGELYVWGRNSNGQLGLGDVAHRTAPVLLMSGVTDMAAGASHSVFVKTDGTAWAMGLNGTGQLGDNSVIQRTAPVQMTGVTSAVAVAAGASHTLVRRTDNTVRAAGSNSWGQLGDASNTQRTTAVAVSGLSTVVEIAAGTSTSYARLADGTVRGWGRNDSYQLGDNTLTSRPSPVTVTGLASIAGIGAGQTFGIAVSTTGVVYTWGSNSYGEQGDGTTNQAPVPHAISGPNYAWKVATPTLSPASNTYWTNQTVTVTNVMSGTGFEMHYTTNGVEPTLADPAIANNGTISVTQSRTVKVKAWMNPMPASDTATRVYTLQATAPTISPAGATYTTARTITLSTTTPAPAPVIHYTTDGSTPTASSTVYSGPFSIATSTVLKTIARKAGWSDSTVSTANYTFNYGTLAAPAVTPATGTYTSSVTVAMSSVQPGAVVRYTVNTTGGTPTVPDLTSPIYAPPLTLTGTTKVRARAFHPDYVTSADTNREYTLVTATPTFSLAPGSYAAGTTVTISSATPGATINYSLDGTDPLPTHPTVASGGSVVLGNFTLKAKAWASNQTTSPTATAAYTVTGTSATMAVAGGDSHSLALRGDGAIFGWGHNVNRQLADGSTTNRPLPVQVGGVTGATAITAGNFFSLARLADGRVVGWGSNGSGQLGTGNTTGPTWPVPASGLTTVVSLDAGDDFALALLADGTVRSWGLNSVGQLGDSTTTSRSSPVVTTGLTSVAGVSGGGQFGLAVKTDGTAWSWGSNGNGQLGTGDTTQRSTPGAVVGVSGVTAVAAGGYTSYFLLSDGTVRAVGYNGLGNLGIGSSATQSLTVVTVSGLSDVAHLAAGGHHVLARKNDGTVWAWGMNGNGQVGNGTTTNASVPVLVQGLPPIASIGAGANHSLAVAVDGSVWAWGYNVHGQLGDGSQTRRLLPVQIAAAGMGWIAPIPALSVAAGTYFANQTVTVTNNDTSTTMRYTLDGSEPTPATPTTVASGGTVSITESRTLKVKAWRTGYLPSPTTTAAYELKVVTPTATPGTGAYASPQNVTLATTTADAFIRYTTDGTEPTLSSTQYPPQVSVSSTLTLRARGFKTGWTPSDAATPSYFISAGTVATPTVAPAAGTFTAAPLVTLASATAGATLRYTLDGTAPGPASPVYRYPFVVAATTTVKVQAFKAGMTASAVATAAYAVDAAGATATPTITPAGGVFTTRRTVMVTGPGGAALRFTTTGADPTLASDPVPVNGQIVVDRAQVLKVRAFASGLTPSAVRRADFVITGAVAAGYSHSLALKADGTVWAWGGNHVGQVGNGTQVDQLTPVQVLTGAVAIAANDVHSLAVKGDGTVWAWGYGQFGRLGDGTGATRTSPVQVIGITNAVAVAAGATHSLVVKADGTVWAFGDNTAGALGDGTTTQRLSPVQVLGMRGVVAVAAGQDYSVALQSDTAGQGAVWTWGKNASGQLGDSTTLTRLTPVRVPLATPVSAVTATWDSTAVLGADGRVTTWGKNDTGQLGIGTTTALSMTPALVPVLTGVGRLAAGRAHVLAHDAVGRVWAWGSNFNYQLVAGPSIGANQQSALAPYPSLVPTAIALAAGSYHSLAVIPDGRVVAGGSNGNGQLGTGVSGFQQAYPAYAGTLTVASNAWLAGDADNDGLITWREYLLGTDPLNRDTNGNGINDGTEASSGAADGGNPDTDGDGLANWVEVARGLDPFRADTDGDGVNDTADYYPLDPTRWLPPTPTPGDVTPPVITLTAPTGARPVP